MAAKTATTYTTFRQTTNSRLYQGSEKEYLQTSGAKYESKKRRSSDNPNFSRGTVAKNVGQETFNCVE